VWVDTPSALHDSGDFHAALKQGWDKAQLAGDLWALLGTNSPVGANGAEGRVVFKSVGHAAQDLAVLTHIWQGYQASQG